MCFRIILYIYVTYFILHTFLCVNGNLIRETRSESSDSSDNSKSFSDALQAFLSSLFGTKNNETDTADEPVGGNLSSPTPGHFLNISGGSATEIENNTHTMPEDEYHLSNASQTSFTNSSTNTTAEPEVENSLPEVLTTVSSAWDIMSTTMSKAENGRCSYDTHLKYYCVLPGGMSDAVFSDLYSLFFSDTIVNALTTACPRGSWCLQDSTGYWESLIFEKIDSATRSLLSANMCTQQLQSCVNNMMNNFVDCSLYPKMQITTQVMQLICDLKENKNLTSTCYKEVLITLHVTIADVLRNGDNVENGVSTCQSPEAYMAKRLICAEVACPKESKTFHSFTPWSWFMSVEDDLMIECKLTPSSCDVPEQTGTPVNGNVVTTTGKQAPQLEVKPQEENTATSGTSSFTTSQYSSSTTWPESSTSYPPEDEKCYTDAVFQNFCPVPDDMADVSFWDLYSVFFSDSVLDALMIGCTKGSWCLKDKFDYWQSLIVERVDMVMHSEIAESMCNPSLEVCLERVVNNFNNCSMYSQMVYTTEVLKLVCGMKQNPRLESPCYMHVISALHVTLADLLREKENDESSNENCESPEAHMTKGLICVENSCPGESETFQSFKPWSWFTSVVDDLIDECNYDPTTCLALLQAPAGYGSDMGTLVGISVATMVTALTLTVVVCTCYKRHRRNAVVKEGYQRLLTDGDES